MGCFGSSLIKQERTVKQIRKPKPWKFPRPVTWSQLVQMRDEFWDTAPHHGGKKEIWDAIHAAAEADIELAQAIVDSAGVIVHKPDMTVCYDERGVTFTHLFPLVLGTDDQMHRWVVLLHNPTSFQLQFQASCIGTFKWFIYAGTNPLFKWVGGLWGSVYVKFNKHITLAMIHQFKQRMNTNIYKPI